MDPQTQAPHSLPAAGTESGPDVVAEALRFLWAARVPVVVMGLLLGALTAVASLQIPNEYDAEVLLAPAKPIAEAPSALDSLGGLAGAASLGGLAIGQDPDESARLATLTSRQFLFDVIRRHDMRPRLFPDRWDAANRRWRSDRGGGRPPSLALAHRVLLSDHLTVRPDRRTGLVTLTVRHRDPVLAARWANAIVSDANAYLRARAIADNRRSLRFLETRAPLAKSQAVQTALFRLVERQLQRATLLNSTPEYAFNVIDRAFVPERKTWPPRALFSLGGAFLGGLMGLVIHALRVRRRARN